MDSTLLTDDTVIVEVEIPEYALVSDGDALVTVPLADYEPSYGVGTSNLEIFRGLANKLEYGEHYVYFRHGQYDYCFASSRDLVCTDRYFSGTDVELVTYNTYYTSGSQPTFTVETVGSFSLDAGSYLVYSDLGDYPVLVERGVRDYAQATLVMLCSVMLFGVFSRIRYSFSR